MVGTVAVVPRIPMRRTLPGILVLVVVSRWRLSLDG